MAGLGLLVLILFAFAYWAARVAGRKGYSFIGFFIFGFFFNVIAIIVAYLIPPRDVPVR